MKETTFNVFGITERLKKEKEMHSYIGVKKPITCFDAEITTDLGKAKELMERVSFKKQKILIYKKTMSTINGVLCYNEDSLVCLRVNGIWKNGI